MKSSSKSIDLGSIFSSSLTALQKYFVFFLQVMALLVILHLVSGVLINGARHQGLYPFVSFITVVRYIANIIISLGLLKGALRAVDHKKPSIDSLIEDRTINQVANYFIATLVSGLLIVVGLFLFIIPGIYFILKYMFTTLVIADKNVSFSKALKISSDLTQGRRLELFVILLLLIVVNIAGALLLGVGLIVTIPLTSLVLASIYRTLQK